MRIKLLLLSLLITPYCISQISYDYNSIRIGDHILKQQVEYKDPGKSGENRIWDFSKLNTVQEDYTLSYSSPYLIDETYYVVGKDTIYRTSLKDKELIVGVEHNTMYYYIQDKNKITLIGYENPVTLSHYSKPYAVEYFSLKYGQESESSSESDIEYSSKYHSKILTSSTTKTDAYGMMLLPLGDTLKHTIRIETIEKVKDLSNPEDSMQIERYKWYTKGYRYPIFETINTIIPRDTLESFASSFYYPPQDHFYLDLDDKNTAILDSLWDAENMKVKPKDIIEKDISISFSYNFYPNPVQNFLTVEYYLEKKSEVSISIIGMSGKIFKTITKPNQTAGMYTEKIDFQTYPSGNYIISISTGSNVYSDKIIKK